ncbi:cytochrome P450 [Glonium stellatum]|uniref:Cytochrome P450 n=1 Tax=Glonium stellatum TaxID=574774 RepID=A0A8E2FAE2_9PEZI|nr:cytochrome P450 [Glonium stellatum]
MAEQKPTPQLPTGNASVWHGISENFSFHSSPESFIASRVLDYQKANPELLASRVVIRAKILNRNVAVVSSHAQITQVLQSAAGSEDESPAYVAGAAYNELMAPFFPSPNLLLMDGQAHSCLREEWEKRIHHVPETLQPLISRLTRAHFASLANSSETDLYKSLKELSWKILLGAFLGLRSEEEAFPVVEGHQETLLRGQFSLMPVNINTGFWHSPRKKGVDAKTKLQQLMSERLQEDRSKCPFELADECIEDVAKHCVLFTSSLAAKALASFMTAAFINLYLFPGNERGLVNTLRTLVDPDSYINALKSIMLETERLSPPIVGIMRRSTKENIISSTHGHPDVLIPEGWDVWLYFVGGGRDPAAYGETFNRFLPERYISSDIPPGFAFGAGRKTCLGQSLTRQIVMSAAQACLDMRLTMAGNISSKGVRGWLGWDDATPEEWAVDMKQLPAQRPSKPIQVRIGYERRP